MRSKTISNQGNGDRDETAPHEPSRQEAEGRNARDRPFSVRLWVVAGRLMRFFDAGAGQLLIGIGVLENQKAPHGRGAWAEAGFKSGQQANFEFVGRHRPAASAHGV
jgi:hypothetical protein